MKPRFTAGITIAATAAFLFGVSGCNRSTAEVRPQVHVAAATYKEGHGLKLSASGAVFVGLKTAELTTRSGGTAVDTLAIPNEALLRTVKGDFVYVANGDWFLRTPVKVGAREGERLALAEGVYEGDRVVVAGTRALWLAELHAVNGGVGCAHGH